MTKIQFNRLMKAIGTGCHLPGQNFGQYDIRRNCIVGSMLLQAGLSEEECRNAGSSVDELSGKHRALLFAHYGTDMDVLDDLQQLNDEIQGMDNRATKERRKKLAQYACDTLNPTKTNERKDNE